MTTTANFVPAEVALKLYAGDDHYLVLEMWSDDLLTVPRSIAGMTYACQIRKKRNSEDADMYDLTSNIAIHNTTGGSDPTTVTVKIPKAVTAVLPATGFWDLQETNPSGDASTLYNGAVTVTKDVTR